MHAEALRFGDRWKSWSSKDSAYGTGNSLSSPFVLADVLSTAVRDYLTAHVGTEKWRRDVNQSQLSMMNKAKTVGQEQATVNHIVAHLIRTAITKTHPTRLSRTSADPYSWAGLFDGTTPKTASGRAESARSRTNGELDMRSLLLKTHQVLSSPK